ncbi:MAG: carboxypeptidase-like regulatory domain-containing protein [Bacteroidota bacterium]
MKRVYYLFLLGLLSLPTYLLGQVREAGVFQISGLVLDKTEGEAIPYARVQVNHTRRGVMSNSEGFYSVAVGILDTLYFTHIGFHPSKLVVRDYVENYQGDISSGYIYAINYMTRDTVTLDTVVIYPYDTPEELRTALVNLDITETVLERNARENLDPKSLHKIMATLPLDGNERLMVARNMYYDYYRTRNLIPTIGFDPIAATRLLQQIAKKATKRKNKDLNYWE